MKTFIATLAFVLFILFAPFAAGAAASPQPNAHVTLDAKAPPAMKAGAAQDLKIFFHPKKGIHVNLTPAIEISLDKSSGAASVGKITASKDAHGYLDPSKPVVVRVTVPADAPKGKRALKLKVVYFLCSDAEGWCNRDEKVLDVSLTVK